MPAPCGRPLVPCPLVRVRADLADWLSLAALVAMWGTAFAVIRLAVATVPPLSVAAGRIVVAAAALYLTLRLAGFRLPRRGRLWLWFALLATVGNALPFYLISWGQERVASGVAGILMASNPLVTFLLAHYFVAGERVTRARLLGLGLGFAGVAVLMGPAALAEVGGDPGRQAAILGGALCYAANSVLTRRMPEVEPLVASTGVLLVASLLVTPAALVLGTPAAPGPSGASLVALLWLGLVPTAAATIVYFRLVRSAGPTFLSLVNYPVPIVAVATGALAFGERPGAEAWVALALILSGIALTQLRRG